jgi:LysM repeat protein
MRRHTAIFCIFYAACCINDSLGQEQETTLIKPVDEKREKPKPPAAEKPKAKPVTQTYVIKSGDNPWTISKALKVDHQKIMGLNRSVDFRELAIGQQIKVPKK